ncbi:hypothetical protein [Conexibacter sp. SYSU D00693]|uniref:SLOG cluster 4 domain-containing protein n=1 Tax=Conexibacter sp. SYSU D00693 TaxID=2812560 RepID=UPI00196B878F|nr:hypothetical protein [Conexibacter sp. SYSU D00693]
MPEQPPYVAVVGPSRCTPEQAAAAEEVGAGIAAAGGVLVSGGGPGVMEAACRGARSRRGVTLGLLPGLDRREANGWVTVAVPTGLGELRNGLVVRAADVVVAVGASAGTLSEMALAVGTGVPLVGLGSYELEGVEPVGDAAAAVARALELARTRVASA